VNHFIPGLLLVLLQKCRFPPFKANWVKEAGIKRNHDKQGGRRKR